MQISKDMVIAGAPAMKLRDMFKQLNGYEWDAEYLEGFLNLPPEKAHAVLQKLLDEGWIEASRSWDKTPHFQGTDKASQLALASATKPIKRSTADRLIQQVIDRAEEINASNDYVFWVSELHVFGSYLTQRQTLGDVDVMVTLIPRLTNADDQEKISRAFCDSAKHNGKRFRTFIDRLIWPAEAIFRHIKGKSRALSLHPHHDAVAQAAERKLIYRR